MPPAAAAAACRWRADNGTYQRGYAGPSAEAPSEPARIRVSDGQGVPTTEWKAMPLCDSKGMTWSGRGTSSGGREAVRRSCPGQVEIL